MDLYLIRHADAIPLGEAETTRDEDRPLTKKGEDQARRLGTALPAKGVHLHMVLTSPLLRARQTAEGMLRDWPKPEPQLRVSQELAPGGKRRKLSRFLAELGAQNVALVGHQPDLDQYVAWLIGSKKAKVELAKAGVAYVSCEQEVGKGKGTLAWMVTPELLSSS